MIGAQADPSRERDTLPDHNSLRSPGGGPGRPPRAAALGLQAALLRLSKRPAVYNAILAVALCAVAAIIERRASAVGAVDRSLRASFGLVLPLATFALSAIAFDRTNVRDAAWPLARFGLARRDVAIGFVVAAVAVSAALGAVLGASTVAFAPPASRALGEAFLCAWIGALTGAAYASWFALGSTFFRKGGGRVAVLIVDFLAGSGTGVLAFVFPRAHAESLLGGAGPLDIAQPASTAALVTITIAVGIVAALRAGP